MQLFEKFPYRRQNTLYKDDIYYYFDGYYQN